MSRGAELDYPVVAITDVHGHRRSLDRLLRRLATRPDWSRSALVFVGDYVDRGPDARGTIDRILGLAKTHPGGAVAVMGNHDLALVRAARLDGGPRSDFWVDKYRDKYDHEPTFRSYLGRAADRSRWDSELLALRDVMPADHRAFLVDLPWVAETAGHVFVHCGLSPDLEATADEQLASLRARRWDDSIRPRPGTVTAARWQVEYPVWLGADHRLAEAPLPIPGRVQVTGHRPVDAPDVNPVRIRLDTSGGYGEPLTACLLSGPDAPPEFIRSDDTPSGGGRA